MKFIKKEVTKKHSKNNYHSNYLLKKCSSKNRVGSCKVVTSELQTALLTCNFIIMRNLTPNLNRCFSTQINLNHFFLIINVLKVKPVFLDKVRNIRFWFVQINWIAKLLSQSLASNRESGKVFIYLIFLKKGTKADLMT